MGPKVLSLVVCFICVYLITSVYSQVCTDNRLGLHLRLCQPCGSPGLDDFCLKRFGRCNNYISYSGYTFGGAFGSSGVLPPVGYLGGFLAPGVPPASCLAAFSAAVRSGPGVTVYREAGPWDVRLPRVSFNDLVRNLLLEVTPTSNCLENNAPYPNGVWNFNPGRWSRIDSFLYNDFGNSTWSYQCYCDFCYACQGCTNG